MGWGTKPFRPAMGPVGRGLFARLSGDSVPARFPIQGRPVNPIPSSGALHPFAGRDLNWLLDWRAHTRRDHPYLVWEPFVGQRRVWTYGQFRDKVLRVAAGLRKRGVQAGDFVLVHLDNCPELEFLWFACARLTSGNV